MVPADDPPASVIVTVTCTTGSVWCTSPDQAPARAAGIVAVTDGEGDAALVVHEDEGARGGYRGDTRHAGTDPAHPAGRGRGPGDGREFLRGPPRAGAGEATGCRAGLPGALRQQAGRGIPAAEQGRHDTTGGRS